MIATVNICPTPLKMPPRRYPCAKAAERTLDEGMCHILATDAHHMEGSPLWLRAGFEAAAKRLGEDEAINLVLRRPYEILENCAASTRSPVGVMVVHDSRATELALSKAR